jgi:hypothetical protein
LNNGDAMKMNVILKICSMAHDYKLYKNKNMFQLLKTSGYFEYKDIITKEKVIEEIKNNPRIIGDWALYSDDKRTPSGWYFQQRDTDKWVVGYFDGKNIKKENEQIFTSAFEACATFILRETEKLGQELDTD